MSNSISGVDYFYYQGKMYPKKTKIKVSQAYRDTHLSDGGKPIWPSACFVYKFIKDNITYYVFNISDIDIFGKWHNYAGEFVIKACMLDCAIEEITTPEMGREFDFSDISNDKYGLNLNTRGSKSVIEWIAYLVAMIGCLIFRQFYIAWIIVTIIFIMYIKGTSDV